MLGLSLVYIFAGQVRLAIDHHLLLYFCHSPTFAAEQLYLSFCRGYFACIIVTLKRSCGMPIILLFGCLEVEGYIRHYTSSKSRRLLLVSIP